MQSYSMLIMFQIVFGSHPVTHTHVQKNVKKTFVCQMVGIRVGWFADVCSMCDNNG